MTVLPRSVCEEPSFSLSTEFFGQVFRTFKTNCFLPFYYDFTTECDCDPLGTAHNDSCDKFGGSCTPCNPGVTGARCDQCMNGWFNFSLGVCQGTVINITIYIFLSLKKTEYCLPL